MQIVKLWEFRYIAFSYGCGMNYGVFDREQRDYINVKTGRIAVIRNIDGAEFQKRWIAECWAELFNQNSLLIGV